MAIYIGGARDDNVKKRAQRLKTTLASERHLVETFVVMKDLDNLTTSLDLPRVEPGTAHVERFEAGERLHMSILDLSRLTFDMRGLFEPSKAVLLSFDNETWSVGQRKE